ncbi:MAG: helix-turn-helix domain-containing protein [Proteobacteria bacterium]|nr:helix-turn-helix domain-containing protein [Pseudomonadota bacterium]
MVRRHRAAPPQPDLFTDLAEPSRPVAPALQARPSQTVEVAPDTALEAASRLGPITEERFRQAFAASALVSAKDAARLVGVDVETLSRMADEGIVRAVRKGRLRSYTEHDLRAYLLAGPDAPSHRGKSRSPSTSRRPRAVPFSQRARRG